MPPNASSPKGLKSSRRSSPRSKHTVEAGRNEGDGSSGRQGATQVARVQLFSTAFAAPAEVYVNAAVPLPKPQSNILRIVGVGLVAFADPDSSLDKTSPIFAHGEVSSRGDRESGDDGSADETDATERFSKTDGLPRNIAQLLARAQRRTRQMLRSSAKLQQVFDPVVLDFKRAVESKTSASEGVSSGATFTAVVDAEGQGTGLSSLHGNHVLFRLLGHLSASRKQTVAHAAAIARAEFLRHCQNSDGAASVHIMKEILRAAIGVEAPSTWYCPRADQNCRNQEFGQQRAQWLEQRAERRTEILQIGCVSRAETSEFQTDLSGLTTSSILVEHESSCQGPLLDEGSAATQAAQVSFPLWHHASGGFEESAARHAGMTDEDLETITRSGERRLEFWDGFLTYRELGSVSRALAGMQEMSKDSDDGKDGGLVLQSLLKSHGSARTHDSTSTRSPFALEFSESDSYWGESTTSFEQPIRASRGDGGIFPALGHRRSKAYSAILRRPPGATALPLPFSARRPKGTVDAEGVSPRLPSLEIAHRSPTAARWRKRSTAGKNAAVGVEEHLDLEHESVEPDLPVLPDTFKPIPPMFIGGVPNTGHTESQPLPFVSHGIGFDQQIFAQGKAPPEFLKQGSRLESPSASNAPTARLLVQFPRSHNPWERAELSGESPHRTQQPDRCTYCVHHNIEASDRAPWETWRQRALMRTLQQRAKSSVAAVARKAARLCSACGGNIDSHFRPRGLSVVREFMDGKGHLVVAASAGESEPVSLENEFGVERLAADSGRAAINAELVSAHSSGASPEHVADGCRGQALRNGHPAARAFSKAERGVVEGGTVTSNDLYFLACEKRQARPLAHVASSMSESVEAIESHTSCTVMISMRHAELDDRSLLALQEDLTQRVSLYDHKYVNIDVSGNRLTDNGVRNLFLKLDKPLGWARYLEVLDLSRNRKVTAHGLEPLRTILMDDKLEHLQVLRLSGIEVGDAFASQLLAGIDSAASSTLQELDLSFTGLGRMSLGPLAVEALLRQCTELSVVDLSGNHFNKDAVAAIARGLADVGVVRVLHMAHNTGAWPAATKFQPKGHREYSRACRTNAFLNKVGGHPFVPPAGSAMGPLCEHLASMHCLRLLDLRDAQVDPCCAFMLASVLSAHPQLEVVMLNGNPLGPSGVRFMLSVALLGSSAGCASNRLDTLTMDPLLEDSMLSGNAPPLQLSNPSGSYALDLRDALARAVVLYCLHQWSLLPQESRVWDEVFISADLDGKMFKEPARNQDGEWELPRSGMLAFTMLLPDGQTETDGRMPHGPKSCDGFVGNLQRPQDRHKRVLTPEQEDKVLHLAASCRQTELLLAIAHALALDFHVGSRVIQTLMCWISEAGGIHVLALQRNAVELLLDGAILDVDGQGSEDFLSVLLDMLVSHPECLPPHSQRAHRMQLQKDPAVTLEFTVPENPTGHYALNLGLPADRLVADRLLLANAWAVQVRKAKAAADVSQTGNYQCIRNESLDSTRFTYQPEWVTPSCGTLDFDLAMPIRPPKSQKAMKDDEFNRLVDSFRNADLPVPILLLCLRRISPALVVTCQQVLRMMQTVMKMQMSNAILMQYLLMTILIFCIRDYSNLYSTFFKGQSKGQNKGQVQNSELLRACEVGIGRLNMMDPVEIHHRGPMLLSLSVHEDRKACRILLAIAWAEGGKALDPKCFRGCCAYGPNEKSLKAIPAPPDWWAKASPPLHGVFSVAYAGDDGNVKLRRRLARQICAWES